MWGVGAAADRNRPGEQPLQLAARRVNVDLGALTGRRRDRGAVAEHDGRVVRLRHFQRRARHAPHSGKATEKVRHLG
eukprot:SAG25_NODE_452_length_7882_cov_1.783117_5_plen_77_part_00